MEYGYNFIEKFIQVPFVIPQPSEECLEKLMDRIMGAASKKTPPKKNNVEGEEKVELSGVYPDIVDELGEKKESATTTVTAKEDENRRVTEQDERKKQQRKEARIAFDKDSHRLRNIVLTVNDALGSNPRRVKQFINLLRLRAYIAIETGLIDPDIREIGKKDWTFEKLGKLIAISLRWPLLLVEMEKNDKMLSVLETAAWSDENPEEYLERMGMSENMIRWGRRKELIQLLRAGSLDEYSKRDPQGEVQYSLAGLDLERFLQVSPRVRSLADEVQAWQLDSYEYEDESIKSVETKIEEPMTKKAVTKKKSVKKKGTKKKKTAKTKMYK